jgi:hypothetical protein
MTFSALTLLVLDRGPGLELGPINLVRANIEQVAFREGPDRRRHLAIGIWSPGIAFGFGACAMTAPAGLFLETHTLSSRPAL